MKHFRETNRRKSGASRLRSSATSIAIALALCAGVATSSGAMAASTESDAAAVSPKGWGPFSIAIAMGDSFVSGEGAGAYQGVGDPEGYSPPATSDFTEGHEAFFCHRSQFSSLNQAALTGINLKVNAACSGGRPADLMLPGIRHHNGQTFQASQLDQLEEFSKFGNIKLILFGFGSNSPEFTFGGLVSECVGRFITDGYIVGSGNSQGCGTEFFPTAIKMQAASNKLAASIDFTIQRMEKLGYLPGSFRLVVQDYTSPLPERANLNPAYLSSGWLPGPIDPRFQETGIPNGIAWMNDWPTENGSQFRSLVAKRYAGGCPVHLNTLDGAAQMSDMLNKMVRDAFLQAKTMRNNAAHDIVYLGVGSAFDGDRLCENAPATPLSPPNANVLVNPIKPYAWSWSDNRLYPVTNLLGIPLSPVILPDGDRYNIERMLKGCELHDQWCQESYHPNAKGTTILGQCLNAAYNMQRPNVNSPSELICSRNRITKQLSFTIR